MPLLCNAAPSDHCHYHITALPTAHSSPLSFSTLSKLSPLSHAQLPCKPLVARVVLLFVAVAMLNRSFRAPSSSRHSGDCSARERSSAVLPADKAQTRAQTVHRLFQQYDDRRDAPQMDDEQYERCEAGEHDDDDALPSSPASPHYESSFYVSSFSTSRGPPTSPSFSTPSSPCSRSSSSASCSPASSRSLCASPTPWPASSRVECSAASSLQSSSSFPWPALSSLSSLLSSVQAKLPFLSSSSAAVSASFFRSRQPSSAGKRKRSKSQRPLHSAATAAAAANDSVVIDVRTRSSPSKHSSSNSKRQAERRAPHARQSSVSVKKRKMLHVLVVQPGSEQQQQRRSTHHSPAEQAHQCEQSSSGVAERDRPQHTRALGAMRGWEEAAAAAPPSAVSSRLCPPLAAALVDPLPTSASSRPPLPPLPVSFPALDSFASSVASGAVQCLSESDVDEMERQLEADVYQSLAAVDTAIQRELDSLVSGCGLTMPEGTLSFRQLVLRVFDASSNDRRLRKLCAMEPQWTLYVLQTLRQINQQQKQQSTVEGWQEKRAGPSDGDVLRETAPVRASLRRRSSYDTVHERDRGASSSRLHRRVASESGATFSHSSSAAFRSSVRCSAVASLSFPHTFSLFISSASGISYPLRSTPAPSFPALSAAFPSSSPSLRPRPASFVRSLLSSATSLHVLLASLVYLSLLHTTDSACLRKSQFALAVLYLPSFLADRPRLPLSHPLSSERARRVASREKEYCRELYYMLDSCCLSLIQHELLPTLPFTSFDELSLPPLPIAHSLGLR